MSSNLLRNIGGNYLGLIVSGLANFCLIPVLFRHLGAEAYGILALCWSSAGFLQFLEFGFHGAVVKYIAEWKAAGDSSKLQDLMISGLLLFFLLGIGSALLMILFAANIADWFHVSATY